MIKTSREKGNIVRNLGDEEMTFSFVDLKSLLGRLYLGWKKISKWYLDLVNYLHGPPWSLVFQDLFSWLFFHSLTFKH